MIPWISVLVFVVVIPCFAFQDILELCYQECTIRSCPARQGIQDTNCRNSSEAQKCLRGCRFWSEAVTSSCQEVCNETGTEHVKDVHCMVGCSIGISVYLQTHRDEIGVPPAPYLVADSRTNESVIIQWSGSDHTNISYLVQWKYDTPSATWEYFEPDHPLKEHKLKISGLHPYTKYKFRVAWILLPQYGALLSEESVVISTLPYGAPSTAPEIISLTAVGSTRVSISWESPLFPNAPVLSYVLSLKDVAGGPTIIKDVSDTAGGLYYMFTNLQPSTNYSVSVTTRNIYGEGPARVLYVTTLPKEKTLGIQVPEPHLILASAHSVLKQSFNFFDYPQVLYEPSNSTVRITGVAIHVKLGLIFVADSLGLVHKFPMISGPFKMDQVIQRNTGKPGLLSIDWLNHRLYMVEENQISRCSFSGDEYEVVVSGFKKRPSDLKVDPYNGYLYWVLQSEPTHHGLYRVDLERIDQAVIPYQEATQIVRDKRLVSFAVDHKNFRLLVPCPDLNTVFSVALDGTDSVNIRENSQTPRFDDAASVATHNGSFYWTTKTGTQMYVEEYHQKDDKYYHNGYILKGVSSILAVKIWHPFSQPHPVPLNPVLDVQAVFKANLAKIAWRKPRLLGGLGNGAWQKWTYEVTMKDDENPFTILGVNITDTYHTIHSLKPNTVYNVQVRAYSIGGKGPWSAKFVGKTITESKPGYPFMLWSAKEGLLKSDIVGENVEPIIHSANLNQTHVTGISWYNGLLVLNTNASRVYTYNTSSSHGKPRLLPNLGQAASIAVDWLAPKLYWSTPVHQLVSRVDLDGNNHETLPIVTVARELAVDSPAGRLYWATAYSVECTRLNGVQKTLFFETGLFSGQHVMGLTLDFDNGLVYWMVRSQMGAVLYSAAKLCPECMKPEGGVRTVGFLPEEDVRGPLWYFSERLFWLHESKEALISDDKGDHVATLKGLGLDGLRSMAVVDPRLQPMPDYPVCVVPNAIKENQVVVDGTWDNFTVVWHSVANVNYGTVFYELKVVDEHDKIFEVTTVPRYNYPKTNLAPYTRLTLSLRSFTYWASSPTTVIYTHTPMSIPSTPTNPRVFISYCHSPLGDKHQIEAEFRWTAPKVPNGLISDYEVTWWYAQTGSSGTMDTAMQKWKLGHELAHKLYNLLPNTTYYFQVRAKTQGGLGPFSAAVEGRTSEERPVPKLLLAKTDAVKVTDVDNHVERLLSNKTSQPIDVTFLSDTKNVYWIEEGGALMSSKMDGSKTTLVRNLQSHGTGMALDWVGRYLYWAEADPKLDRHTVWVMDLIQRTDIRLLLNGTRQIGGLEVDPFSSVLLWTLLQDKDHSHLMVCDVDGRDPRSFFRQSSAYQRSKRNVRHNCNCPYNPDVGRAITIDRSKPDQPLVLWVDAKAGHIWSADMMGCQCKIVVNASEFKDHGLPPSSLTADKSQIYWSNSTLGRIYSIPKDGQIQHPLEQRFSSSETKIPSSAAHFKSQITSEVIGGVRGIKALGDHLQPYPDRACLSPLPYKHEATLVSRSPTTLTLRIPDAERPSFCGNVSLASVAYKAFFSAVQADGTSLCDSTLKNCNTEVTYNTTFTLKNLEPFTNYTVQLTATNYYSQGEIVPGPSVIFQTKEGAPSAPVEVVAHARTPTRIDIQWRPSVVPNGSPIWYEVRWNTGSETSTGQSATYTPQPESEGGIHLMRLVQLLPNTTYFIVVRASSSGGDLHSDSLEVSATTFDQPHNITLINATSRSLLLEWNSSESILHYTIEYTEVGSGLWMQISSTLVSSNNIFLWDLMPKTNYAVRILIHFNGSDSTYTWPQDQLGFIFQTYGDFPDVPRAPEIRGLSRDLYQIVWDEVSRNGGEEMFYELQTRSVAESVKNNNRSLANATEDVLPLLLMEWGTVYNGSHHQWIVTGLQSQTRYEFRVRATTEFGTSNFSEVGAAFILPEPDAVAEPAGEQTEVILIAVFCASVFIVIALLAALYIVQKRRENEKKAVQNNGQILHSPDVELATLRELPQHSNFVQQANALYAVGDMPTDEELSAIPHISREQIGLTKFLGSGAFGEVFEGTAHDLEPNIASENAIKVAIKTLRKGATEQEKGEFLKEAKLMSNFQHEHILKLLGICLNNNPNFIILELMEGGDLLSYLRANRPTAIHPGSLTLDDLFDICVDVAKGCKYLEDMHFVHRDLAARNCLVSSHDPAMRIVKIGDFGLARDIYKNDYYRKEGEGLLPVRWMAPESLIDGIFTCQSDVWAFGVLLWEVVTLGQQPYPAMTNVEVLRYVRGGGRLDKPGSCPEDLHELMLKCWCYGPDSRPTFGYCLETLQDLKHKNSAQSTPLLSHSYIGRYYDGFDNLAYHGEDQLAQQLPEHPPEELAKLRDNASDQRRLLLERPADTLSTCSDPSLNTLQDMLSQLNGVKMDENINGPQSQRTLKPGGGTMSASCSTSPLLKATLWRNGLRAAESAKYLELLADDAEGPTDADGYEIPLPPPVEQRRNYADLHRSPSSCSTASSCSSRVTASQDLQENIDPNRSLCKAGIDNYIVRTRSKTSKTVSPESLKSPMVTSALLKSPASPCYSDSSAESENRLTTGGTEAMNPFYSESPQTQLTCTPSCHRCSDQRMLSPYCHHMDSWSLSSASTATCHDGDNKRNSGISTLSALSGVELNYTPKSSWC